MKTVIASQKGNCYSAGQVMVKVYQALGFKAKLRSAIHDNPKRYPQNMIMGSDHYNVEVVVNGSDLLYLWTHPRKPIWYIFPRRLRCWKPIQISWEMDGHGYSK